MKHILACLFLVCALTLAVSCAFAAQHAYQLVDSERIEYSLPVGLSAKVTLVAPKSIVRSEGKAVRVIDKRKI